MIEFTFLKKFHHLTMFFSSLTSEAITTPVITMLAFIIAITFLVAKQVITDITGEGTGVILVLLGVLALQLN
jgi:hypothetical protein